MKNNALALIAGRGDLPHKIVSAQKDKRPIVVIAFEGQTPTTFTESLPSDIPVLWVKLGAIGAILDFFKQWQVVDVTLAGGLTRPKIRDLSVDRVGASWLKALGMNAFKGDNHLLGGIVALLEKEGLHVVPPHSLVEHLFVPAGVLTKRTPTTHDLADIEHGTAILDVLSVFDVGQAIVVHDGCVLGIETIEGTAAMLTNINALCRDSGGVFIKKKKIGQSTSVDMPTIGPDTVRSVQDAGLSGIAIEAGSVQVLDVEKVLSMADAAGLFVVAFDGK